MDVKQTIVFFDADCALCQFVKRWFFRNERTNHQIEWRHHIEATACGLDGRECAQSLHVQTPDGTVYRGVYAVRHLLGYTRLRILRPLLYIPGVPLLGEKLYAWVARNRYRLFGKAER